MDGTRRVGVNVMLIGVPVLATGMSEAITLEDADSMTVVRGSKVLS